MSLVNVHVGRAVGREFKVERLIRGINGERPATFFGGEPWTR